MKMKELTRLYNTSHRCWHQELSSGPLTAKCLGLSQGSYCSQSSYFNAFILESSLTLWSFVFHYSKVPNSSWIYFEKKKKIEREIILLIKTLLVLKFKFCSWKLFPKTSSLESCPPNWTSTYEHIWDIRYVFQSCILFPLWQNMK